LLSTNADFLFVSEAEVSEKLIGFLNISGYDLVLAPMQEKRSISISISKIYCLAQKSIKDNELDKQKYRNYIIKPRVGFVGRGGEQGTSLSYLLLRGKTWLFLTLTLTLSQMTALPGGKNLPIGQVAHAGGGIRLQQKFL